MTARRKQTAPRVTAKRRRGGFTLLEVVVATAILAVAMVALGKTFLDLSRAFSSLSKLMHLQARSQTVMSRLVDELVTGNFTSLYIGSPMESTSVEFQKITGTDGSGNPIYSNTFRIDLTPLEVVGVDGLDNDGDGLVDEHAIRIWEDFPPTSPIPGVEDNPVTICTNVARNGLLFTREGGLLIIDLTIIEIIEPGEAARSIQIRTGVRMRNN